MQNYTRGFFAEAHTLLKQEGYKNYITKLLPNGKWQGNEYVVKNPTRNDNKAGSFRINRVTGKWGEFFPNNAKTGKDLIGLTSYIKGISPVEACQYIGVPRLEKNAAKTSVEAHTAATTNNKIDNSIEEDEDILKFEQEAIANVDINNFKSQSQQYYCLLRTRDPRLLRDFFL